MTAELLRSLNCLAADKLGEQDRNAASSDTADKQSPPRDPQNAKPQATTRNPAAAPLDPHAQAELYLLTLIHSNPGASKIKLARLLQLSNAKAAALIERLQQQHLITIRAFPAGRGGKLRVPLLTPAGYRLLGIDRQGGNANGGEAHIVVGRCAKKACEQAGYRVTPEHTLAPEYGVRLDLMCRHKTKATTLAINICIDNDAAYEAHAAYRALHCEEIRAGRFCFIARDKGKTDTFKKTIRKLDRALLDHIDFRLAGATSAKPTPPEDGLRDCRLSFAKNSWKGTPCSPNDRRTPTTRPSAARTRSTGVACSRPRRSTGRRIRRLRCRRTATAGRWAG